METGYKVFRADVLRTIPLRSNRFGIEPEITAKVAKRDCIVYEVPISYHGRTYSEGKKITWKDGLKALCVILKYMVIDDCVDKDIGHAILRELGKAQEKSRLELEQRILERTRELENTISTLQMAQQQETAISWEEYTKSQKEASSLTLNADEETHLPEDWLSRLSQAVEKAEIVQESNGQGNQSITLPRRTL